MNEQAPLDEQAAPHAGEPLRVEHRPNGVTVLTFDNPDKRNPMTGRLTAQWRRAMRSLRQDPDLRAVVITGTGPAFCSGADLGELADRHGQPLSGTRAQLSDFYRTWLTVRDLSVPTVAAVNGHAVGAGLALALACDLRYAAAEAKLGAPFVRLGLHPGMATTALLAEAVGPSRARELLLTGRLISGARAATIGMVHEALPADQVLRAALDVADEIAAAAPLAVRLTKSGLAQGQPTVERALTWEGLAQPVTTTTDDFREGIQARRERRRPHFTGA
ncbi:enoyl-CoA hydratase/isomerase family protein [Streptomyces yunnanensis]|uniref:Enoyl-CoA hydratase/isomerase family protein n=1 Tax=Streptomyces yunnanensis TaxID=156453 RepID=A0ABY8A6H1_9ACTN|nr:enoyl-CoA hydratase/isomerase family protein [Streptomyces yunnanensis]WEB39510.1 enoyl-CoA hydratase/isomerase family protein [Streptomyces yunnanensis]